VHIPLSKLKRDTVYTAGQEDGQSVLKAVAESSASIQAHLVRFDPMALPMLEWRWRVPALIKTADNRDPKREDAPVRLMVAFDGDKTKLTEKERSLFARAKRLSGREPPYALLMYIWDNVNPVGTVIASAHSTRVKMMVAESGPGHVGSWQSYRRNLAEDFTKAFGEAPQSTLGIGLMSDTDNTGTKIEAWYGSIRLGCAAPAGR
jgi:hypothetical protein